MTIFKTILPQLSVILPVYNGLPYLEEAIKSILGQSFGDYELIIINDGSTDGSELVVGKFKDSRIRYFKQQNHGLPATLNIAISHACGEYIARQDQDDICLPKRFQKQVEYLNAHPGVGMVGAAAQIWAGNELTSRQLTHPRDDATLRFGLLFNNLFVHSSIMIRRSVFEQVGAYSEDKSRQPPEDYELWSRVMKKFKVANLPEVLMVYREVPNSMSRTGVNPFLPNLVRISAENIAWASGRAVDSPEVIALSRLSHGVYEDIPRGIRFAALAAVLNDAADRIARTSGVLPRDLEAPLQTKLKVLRYHYLNYRSGGLIGKMTGGRLGRYVKGWVKRMLSVSHS